MQKLLSILALLLLITSPTSTDRILLESCSHGDPPLWIDITGCNTTECVVYDHVFVRMTGEMVATEHAKKLRMEVSAHFWGFRFSYEIPLHRFDGCTMIRGGCPLQKGRRHQILVSGIANLPFTGTKRTIEVILRNEDNAMILCGKSTLKFEKMKKGENKIL